jgi:hypothetical protein
MKWSGVFLLMFCISSVLCTLCATMNKPHIAGIVLSGLMANVSIVAAMGNKVIEELKPKEQKKEVGQKA